MIQQNKTDKEIETEAKDEKKAKEGRLLFYIFGGLIIVLIGLMFFVDYYVESKAGGPRNVHDAAEPG